MLKKLLAIILFAVGLLVVVTIASYQRFLNTSISFAESQLVRVETGESLYKLLSRLEAQGLLRNSPWYKLVANLNPPLSKIKVGTYQLNGEIKPKELLRLFSEGDEHQFQITLIEGDNIWIIKDKLKNHPNVTQTDWSNLMINFDHPEGAFFPDTYAFTDKTYDYQILQRAHDKLLQVIAEQWELRQLDLPYNSYYEALVMASIIEKETGVASERPLIASVLVNRLRLGMRLQTDPTVIYGLGEDFDGDIKRSDLRTPTPYNTYVIKGLPPTPIALASEESIKAALNPLQSDYLYFVAQGDGSHYFSKTLEEHNQAVKRYLEVLENSER